MLPSFQFSQPFREFKLMKSFPNDGDRIKHRFVHLCGVYSHRDLQPKPWGRDARERVTVCMSSFLCSFTKHLLLVTVTYKIAGKRSFGLLKLVWFLFVFSTSMQLKTPILIYIFKNTFYFNLNIINKNNIVKHTRRIT